MNRPTSEFNTIYPIPPFWLMFYLLVFFRVQWAPVVLQALLEKTETM